MGWLHDGHRELMRTARAENATTVVTIFVNPRQFNEASDYTRYPRNEAQDLAICEAAISMAWRPSWRSCSTSSEPTGPISARRTRSR
jgi:pantoate--beta-alanine ligase